MLLVYFYNIYIKFTITITTITAGAKQIFRRNENLFRKQWIWLHWPYVGCDSKKRPGVTMQSHIYTRTYANIIYKRNHLFLHTILELNFPHLHLWSWKERHTYACWQQTIYCKCERTFRLDYVSKIITQHKFSQFNYLAPEILHFCIKYWKPNIAYDMSRILWSSLTYTYDSAESFSFLQLFS